MSHDYTAVLLRHLRRLTGAELSNALSDRDLLERFARRRDEAAFEALVGRHGPMVWRLCRRMLREPGDAEDVFQATFLLLARKAARPGWQLSLGGWLYQVAYRLSLEARRAAARRHRHETRVLCRAAADPVSEITVREAQSILDEEVARLPEKFRTPLILCCLEGLARDEAARQLGWRASVLKSRLEQARTLLRRRLDRRGVVFGVGLAATALAPFTVSASLRAATTKAAIVYTTNRAAAATVIAARVLALAEGAWKAMWITRLMIAATVCAILGLIGGGSGLLAYQALQTQEPAIAVDQPVEVAAADPQEQPKRQEDKQKADQDRELARRLAAAEKAEGEIRRMDAQLDDREHVWLVQLLKARRTLILAEEHLHHLERTQATQATKDKAEWDGSRTHVLGLKDRIRLQLERYNAQLEQLGKEHPEIKRAERQFRELGRLEEEAKERLETLERQMQARSKERIETLVQARVEVAAAQEQLNLLISQQAAQRARSHAHRDALENQVRFLKGAVPLAGQGLPSTVNVEVKLDRLFRELEELRLEVKRLANVKVPGP